MYQIKFSFQKKKMCGYLGTGNLGLLNLEYKKELPDLREGVPQILSTNKLDNLCEVCVEAKQVRKDFKFVRESKKTLRACTH